MIGRLGAAGRGVGCRFPAADLWTDRGDGRRNDSQIFLQPAQRDGEPLCMSSAKVVRGWVWLRREVFDPDDFLCVRIGQRRGSRPATAVPRAPPNVVVALAGHGANDTRGGTPFQASWRGSVAADQPISLSYPTGLLPKAVLIFGCRQDQIGRAGSASTSEHQNKETTARMASYLHCYQRFEHRARGAGPLMTKRCTPE